MSVTICECGVAKSYHTTGRMPPNCEGYQVSRDALIADNKSLQAQLRTLTEQLEAAEEIVDLDRQGYAAPVGKRHQLAKEYRAKYPKENQ